MSHKLIDPSSLKKVLAQFEEALRFWRARLPDTGLRLLSQNGRCKSVLRWFRWHALK